MHRALCTRKRIPEGVPEILKEVKEVPRSTAYRNALIALGLCVCCKRKSTSHKCRSCCLVHYKKIRKSTKPYRRREKNSRSTIVCKSKKPPCKLRRELGLCKQCCRPSKDLITCRKCYEKTYCKIRKSEKRYDPIGLRVNCFAAIARKIKEACPNKPEGWRFGYRPLEMKSKGKPKC